ncbi:alpha/beta hydrolase [Nocardioides aestuarii]|uniref:Alpha/beta hydrolase n=1 Tax=Nocardioides aestuarii TaxID=252231 RepID=A0ABW4TKJ7_9ACTN
MDTDARLVPAAVPRRPEGVALVLHGGGARRDRMRVSPTQLSVLRMVPVAHRIARSGRRRLAVYRLLNSARGWDTRHTPVSDVHWALGRISDDLGPLPVSLVGHSLGGRAALLAGGAPDVQSVVALAPWVQLSDSPQLPGRDVLVVHGTDDRIASWDRARSVTDRLRPEADRVGFVSVEGGRHAMLRHHRLFDGLAAEFVAATLLGDRAVGPVADVLGGRYLVET